MLGFLFSISILLIALYGYYLAIRKSQLEKELRENNLEYECFRCKEKFSIDLIKCPKCSHITIYGTRKKKFWIIVPIIGVWLLMLAKFAKLGIIIP